MEGLEPGEVGTVYREMRESFGYGWAKHGVPVVMETDWNPSKQLAKKAVSIGRQCRVMGIFGMMVFKSQSRHSRIMGPLLSKFHFLW